MRFLADESCDFAVVRALHDVGHDVAAIAGVSPLTMDEVVMELAVREGGSSWPTYTIVPASSSKRDSPTPL